MSAVVDRLSSEDLEAALIDWEVVKRIMWRWLQRNQSLKVKHKVWIFRITIDFGSDTVRAIWSIVFGPEPV